jgi:uncharacterized SAM-binding protein YcdF (DUF218 family)
VAAAVVAAFVVVTLRWFVWPDTEPVAEADAVVVLSGSPERLPNGQALLADGIAPTLAASRGPRRRPGLDCDASAIVCFRADPFSTVGEARRIAELADAREWDELAVVTSTFHLVRARTLQKKASERGNSSRSPYGDSSGGSSGGTQNEHA